MNISRDILYRTRTHAHRFWDRYMSMTRDRPRPAWLMIYLLLWRQSPSQPPPLIEYIPRFCPVVEIKQGIRTTGQPINHNGLSRWNKYINAHTVSQTAVNRGRSTLDPCPLMCVPHSSAPLYYCLFGHGAGAGLMAGCWGGGHWGPGISKYLRNNQTDYNDMLISKADTFA